MPTPITERSRFKITNRIPIGSRYADDETGYTLVAYSVDPVNGRAEPLFIADDDIGEGAASQHWMDRAMHGSTPLLAVSDVVGIGSETLHPAPDDADKAAAAFAALATREEHTFRDTGDFSRVTLYAELNSDEEVAAFLAYAKAELELRSAQRRLERAARDRSERIALVADLTGSQRQAAKVLGVNQSTVSRALRERPERP
ncbi:hypothetical protein ACFV3R_25030 [Streptomyces sp. NPDC059740]|uniref:hypothetical protein n=1 Tax=Streptomyces sp. NPDC059740 TaxID=3346926 RepID=UPI00366618E0